MSCLDNTISLSLTPYQYLTSDKTEEPGAWRMLKTIAAVAALVPATLLYVGALVAQTLLSCCSFSRPVTTKDASMEKVQDHLESAFAEVYENLKPSEQNFEQDIQIARLILNIKVSGELFLDIDNQIRRIWPGPTPLPAEEGKAVLKASPSSLSLKMLKEKLPALTLYIKEFYQIMRAYLLKSPLNRETETLVNHLYANWNFELRNISRYASRIASLAHDKELAELANQIPQELEKLSRF